MTGSDSTSGDQGDDGSEINAQGPKRRRGANQERPRRRRRADRLTRLLGHHLPQQLDRLFLISLQQRYLYCPVSKVANSSIKAFLYEAELRNAGFTRSAADFTTAQVHNFLFGPLLQTYQVPSDMLEDMLSDDTFKRILFVRNPADRLVSCFLDRVRTPGSVPSKVMQRALGTDNPDEISFDQFVGVIAEQDIKDMNPHWRPIYYEACSDKIDYNRIYRFEALQSELFRLLEEVYPAIAGSIDLGINLSPAKTDAGKRVAEFVTPALKAKIDAIYSVDYETFGY
ncbi:MAG: sulfotransferase family 2 domain-containing protein [Pseudomonadota bacterium]